MIIIESGARPHIPAALKVIEHQAGGRMEFDPARVKFHLSPNQLGQRQVGGYQLQKELRKALQGKLVLNACVLDQLLYDPSVIPESWKFDENGNRQYTVFWATRYGELSGHRSYVRALYCHEGGWGWDYCAVDSVFGSQHPAAFLEG